MDLEPFKIYVDRLADGEVEDISEEFSPDFLDQQDDDLVFRTPIKVKGKAYLAGQDLILQLDVQVEAILPCTICNEPVKIPFSLGNFYHVESLDDIKSAVFIFNDVLREAILLETPQFVECSGGSCPMRADFDSYLGSKKRDNHGISLGDEGYKPFADLELN